ncbi:MAG TPA: nucleoside-diphosphate sugar epimerase/dehydratase [Tepidisphaeraceae bacterium]|nr:nucleoside-diphosphate sugar epimerase/dehydratase [Tepidisphaeraceae bacterium]
MKPARQRDRLRKLVTRTKGPAPVPSGSPAPSAGSAATLEDLLRRPAVNLDTPEAQRFLAGKRVMVTGAGGSIGSEICRQVLRFGPERLILVEQAEGALFEIDRELRQRWLGADIVPYVADVTDAVRVGRVFGAERPQVIFHCAAHKHVPMMELNPGEAIKNNVVGTKVVAEAALASGAAAFVMVSTDKAVNPTSVMGATKRFAELYIQSLNGVGERPLSIVHGQSSVASAMDNGQLTMDKGRTRFVAVRFGNVLGSSGSVVPIFARQIAAGGPVTVTHPDMRRYFMTIPEASQLVLQAGAIGRGGEIFVLDMGEPVRILDLAQEMIRRAGLRPHDDIAIEFTGIRPGEKLFEELAGESERTRPTGHPKIRVWELPVTPRARVEQSLAAMVEAVDAPREAAVAALMSAVEEYRPEGVGMRVVREVA